LNLSSFSNALQIPTPPLRISTNFSHEYFGEGTTPPAVMVMPPSFSTLCPLGGSYIIVSTRGGSLCDQLLRMTTISFHRVFSLRDTRAAINDVLKGCSACTP